MLQYLTRYFTNYVQSVLNSTVQFFVFFTDLCFMQEVTSTAYFSFVGQYGDAQTVLSVH